MAIKYTDKEVADHIQFLKDKGLTGTALNSAISKDAAKYGIPTAQLSKVTGYTEKQIKDYNASIAALPKTTAPKISVFSDKEVTEHIQGLKDKGLTGEALNKAILADAAKYNITDAQLAKTTGYTPEEINKYAVSKGTTLLNTDELAVKAAENWAKTQYGRAPTSAEIANVKDIISGGNLTQAEVNKAMDSYTPEAYNYDVQRITSAFRSAYGRNPTSSELANAYDNYKDAEMNADIAQFNKATPALISTYLAQQLAANPDNKEQAYNNVINKALELGVTVDELASATGFSTDEIKGYATAKNLGNLKSYEELRAQSPMSTYMEMESLVADPWGGRYATESPFKLPADAADVVTLSNGSKIQFTKNVFDALDNMSGTTNLRYDDVIAAVNMSLNNGTLTTEEANNLIYQLANSSSMDEGKAILSQPKAFVVVDALYGMQLGQAKTLADAQAMADKVAPLLTQAAKDLGPGYAGTVPAVTTVGELAKDAGIVNYPYSKDKIAEIYNGYNNVRKISDRLDPNAPPGSPFSWQTQVVSPIYKKAAEIVDKGYNPYAMPTQQQDFGPFANVSNPYQRGIDFISRVGERVAYPGDTSGGAGVNVPSASFAPTGGSLVPNIPQADNPNTGGLAGVPFITPTNVPTGGAGASPFNNDWIWNEAPADLNATLANNLHQMRMNPYFGRWAADEGGVYFDMLKDAMTSGNLGPNAGAPTVNATPIADAAAAPGNKAGGIIRKVKIPKGLEYLKEEYQKGKIGLKELHKKIKR